MRPNGSRESSPGHLRPKADALGHQAPTVLRPEGPRDLDGSSRLQPPKISRGLSGRFFGLPFYPRASAFGLRCPGLDSRDPSGRKDRRLAEPDEEREGESGRHPCLPAHLGLSGPVRSYRRSFITRRGPTASSAHSSDDSSGRRSKLWPGEISGSLLPPVRRALRSFSKVACNIRQSLRPISRAHRVFRRGPRNKSRPHCNDSKSLRTFQRGPFVFQRPCELFQRPRDLLKRGLLMFRGARELFQKGLRMRIGPSCVASRGLLVLQRGRRIAVGRLRLGRRPRRVAPS